MKNHRSLALGAMILFGALLFGAPHARADPVHYGPIGRTFTVTDTEPVAKNALPTTRICSSTTDPVLRLITCGGAFDRAAGSCLDNVIVYADQLV